MLVKLQAVFVAAVVLVSQETKFDVNTNFHSIKDGGRSHAIDWGKIDNTYIEKITTRALDEQQKNLFNIISGNFEIFKTANCWAKKGNQRIKT